MILSRFCKIYPHHEDPDSLILFSTKTASIICVPVSLLEDIHGSSISPEEEKTLSDLGFLVKGLDEEKADMTAFMNELNLLNREFRATVVMNLDCNLACRYCFEGTRKGKHYMSRETADEFVGFVEKRCEEHLPLHPPFVRGGGGGGRERRAISEINLVFYGGEPLLSLDLIIYISESLKTLAEGRGISYKFSLITNGTLLTRNTVDKLRTLGLKDASITLDGPKDIHDQYRPHKSGKGSFDLIFKNVKEVCEVTGVQLGGNFTKNNYREFPRLLDYLTAHGLTRDDISEVRFEAVTKESEGIALPDFHEGVVSVNEPWLFGAYIYLREEVLRRGFRTPKITPITCMVEYRDKMFINYDGGIYKCSGLIGREEFKAGDLNSGLKDYRSTHNLDNWKNEECLDCAYLPLCFGGCRYMKLVRDGNMAGVDCKKPFWDAMLEAMVKQDIRYGL